MMCESGFWFEFGFRLKLDPELDPETKPDTDVIDGESGLGPEWMLTAGSELRRHRRTPPALGCVDGKHLRVTFM